ncbi:malectin, partial [Mangrovimonas sp. AS39]|uniref:malectin domain-containing carbohydrate-binding protein n=1 Tax=Mangrovimonas futianensis TaxID=2895523 RepID=UPI001E398474
APSTQALAINAGGATIGTFLSDRYFSGGTVDTVSTSINTAGVANAAPTAVYQSERWGTMTYAIPGLIPGAAYTLRLHFCETWATTGQRRFNVLING